MPGCRRAREPSSPSPRRGRDARVPRWGDANVAGVGDASASSRDNGIVTRHPRSPTARLAPRVTRDDARSGRGDRVERARRGHRPQCRKRSRSPSSLSRQRCRSPPAPARPRRRSPSASVLSLGLISHPDRRGRLRDSSSRSTYSPSTANSARQAGLWRRRSAAAVPRARARRLSTRESEAAFLTVLLAVSRTRRGVGRHRAQGASRSDRPATPRDRTSPARCSSTAHAANAHGSHANCTTSSHTTSRWSPCKQRPPGITTPGMPAAGARQLTAIGDTARAALAEMRQLLGVLRQDTNGEAAERRPQPTLAELADLIDEARDSTGARQRGSSCAAAQADSIPPSNSPPTASRKKPSPTPAGHAAGAAVDVELSYNSQTLHLRVRDNGPGPPTTPTPPGHGLIGMRERAAAVGGQLRTGPATGGGFLVEATPAHRRSNRTSEREPSHHANRRRRRPAGRPRRASPLSSTASQTSPSSARPPTEPKQSASATSSGRTSCSWTSACRRPTASRPPSS